MAKVYLHPVFCSSPDKVQVVECATGMSVIVVGQHIILQPDNEQQRGAGRTRGVSDEAVGVPLNVMRPPLTPH